MNIELVEVEIMLDQIIKNCLDQMQEFVNGVIYRCFACEKYYVYKMIVHHQKFPLYLK